jgi:hypothetical protein
LSGNRGGLNRSMQHYEEVPSPGIPRAKNHPRAQKQRKRVLFR